MAMALAGCKKDETVSGYGGADKTWVLTEVDGKPFNARANLSFPEPGRITGSAPCNRFFGEQTKPYPWFGLNAVGATKMACPNLTEEGVFFEALGDMTIAEVLGDIMILSNENGREMVFKAASTSE